MNVELSSRTSEQVQNILNNIRSFGKEICFFCKGDQLLCNSRRCPLLKRATLPVALDTEINTNMTGPTSSLYVDWYGYPEVALGPTIALNPKVAEAAVSPADWYGYSLEQLIQLKSQAVLAATTHDVGTQNKFIDYLQELAMTTKPVETELHFRTKPESSLRFSSVHAPIGPTGDLEYLKLLGNPVVPKEVEREIADKTKPNYAVWNLYNEGFDVYYLQRLYSAGVFAHCNGPKLVPSSWSIRAIDKHLGNCLVDQVTETEPLEEFLHYSISYLSNNYEILLMPGEWKFEVFEAWAPRTMWTLAYARPAIYQNFEGYTVGSEDIGKSSGSYHAIRLAVLENLKRLWKHATVIVFREVEDDYSLPLGVWHVREAVRNAFSNKPSSFESAEAALNYISVRLRTPMADYTKHGVILRDNT